MMRALAFAAALLLVGCATSALESEASPAPSVVQRAAPEGCDFRDNILEFLAQKYREVPSGAGMTSTGGLVEVLTAPDGGTWAIIVTRPDGWSCMVADGEGWRWLERRRPAT